MGDITGTTFSGYEVRDVIGTDLVSTSYRAAAPDEDRTLALRIVAQDLCVVDGPDRDLYRRFRDQAIASLTFEHEFSPTVEEVGEYHGQGYLVTPYVDSVPLSTLVAERAPLPVDVALDLFAEVADVLDAGREAGLTHGAVNPSTIAFAGRGDDGTPTSAHLTGYGIGALLELRLKRDRKQLTVVDDLLYVAPEQLRQQTVTGRTDQYALACALVHVLTGQAPFVRDSIGGLFGAHLFVDPELEPSWAWSQPISRGMAKEPEQRFDRCGDLISAVRDAVASAATRTLVAPAVPGGATTSLEREDPPGAREPAGTGGPQRGEPAGRDRPRGPQPVAVDDGAGGEPAVFAGSAPPESRNGVARNGYGPPDDDVPLLSDVLSQHDNGRGRSGLRSGGALLALLVLAAAAVALALWLL